MSSDPRAPGNEPIPLLYGPEADSADAVPLVTPSEEEMGRHVAAQMAKADAARQAVQLQERGTSGRMSGRTSGRMSGRMSERMSELKTGLASGDAVLAAAPISAERTARLAALNPVVPGQPAPSIDDDKPLPLPPPPTVATARPVAGNTGNIDSNIHSKTHSRTPSDVVNTLPVGHLAPEPQPQQVGRYLVQKRLGRGSMAAVYRANDPQMGRDVAIKLLNASVCEDEELRLRFLQQARAAVSLSHPNIVTVHDVAEIDTRAYVAMELVDGQPLSVRLEEEGALPLPEVISIGLQLARALEYAAGRGIAHHGIKPGNIMLLAAGPGDDPKIKVTDFGIAQIWPIAPFAAVAKAANAPGRHLQQGTVPGSLQYLSPEQTRGEAADGRSDLFSAGVLLYQMLAGVRPFRADSPVALAACIANDTPPPLPQKRPDVPPALRRVVERCLAKQPEQRYASAKDLAEALLRVQGEVEAAERVRSQPRQVPLRVKWAAALALVVTVVMALTAGLVAQRQYAALMAQVGEHGRSMAGLVAAQHAGQVLGEEWNSIDAQVQEVMRTGSVERLIVVDAAGLVRVSSLPALVGQSYQPEGQALPELSAEGTTVRRFSSQEQSLLGFDAPVLFQGKPLGRVLLGLAEAPLTQVARQSVMLLLLLAGVTVLAVAVAVYFLANWFVRPLRTLADAMAEIGKGRLAHRIAEPRNDEFGQLYQSFDAMAQALQRRNAGADPDSTTRK